MGEYSLSSTSLSHSFNEYSYVLLEVPVLSLAEDVHEVDGLHKDEELLEVQSGEFKIGFEFAEDLVQNGEL